MTAIEIACRICSAQPQEPCASTASLQLQPGEFHHERGDDAAFWSNVGSSSTTTSNEVTKVIAKVAADELF